ncbi:LysR family transcriptional regulator [Goodfellowiella coeruleoviolacea]|uniref:DNA-binding transcriptional regulator, LysR family n=1 Tax=Goodfellowiella coeruleoviolacea TaxID=334858 RepID=A0AAE3GAF1_9PSEU|nr:LysR family transcriptional regulator [Goodfellowiella coeruleoviolacea]MCP2164657.1 DNA-binding transcriptional regulator, LysR family [Goodfellowiella coeruleoviolacea]
MTGRLHKLDLSLLVALDALLETGSVTGAAELVEVSVPTMSKTLRRIRDLLGDPVLVRAGRGMVPTPRAVALGPRVRALIAEAEAILSDGRHVDLSQIRRGFGLVADDGYAALLQALLTPRTRREAPGVTLRFLATGPGDATPLRDGTADLEIGIIDEDSPELRVESLFVDRLVGVAKAGHPLATGPVTPAAFSAAAHIGVSRRGRLHGPLDRGLEVVGLQRTIVATLANFASALLTVSTSDCVTAVPERVARYFASALGLVVFPVPTELDPIEVRMAWHPRHDADPAHRWLRQCVREVTAVEVVAPTGAHPVGAHPVGAAHQTGSGAGAEAAGTRR